MDNNELALALKEEELDKVCGLWSRYWVYEKFRRPGCRIPVEMRSAAELGDDRQGLSGHRVGPGRRREVCAFELSVL